MKGMASRHLPSDASVPHPALACPPVSCGGGCSWGRSELGSWRDHDSKMSLLGAG